jgi:hypothetical protein
VYRVNSAPHVRYTDGCTHRKCGWSSCSIGMAVSSMRLRKRNSRSVARASARVQCRTSWILRTPSACRPCSVSTGPRFTSASQRSCSCSGDIGQVYNAPEYLLCADHFRAVAGSPQRFDSNPLTQLREAGQLLMIGLRTLTRSRRTSSASTSFEASTPPISPSVRHTVRLKFGRNQSILPASEKGDR